MAEAPLTPSAHRRNESSFVQLDLSQQIAANKSIYSHKKSATVSAASRPSQREALSSTVLDGLSTPLKVPPLGHAGAGDRTVVKPRQVSANASKGDKDAEIASLKERLKAAETEVADLKAKQSKQISQKDYAELERQFAAQEALLAGYQKESERGHEELIALRKLKKQMEGHLFRLHGSDWQAELTGATTAARKLGSPGPQSRLGSYSSPLMQDVMESPTRDDSPLPIANSMNAAALPSGLDAMALLAQLEAIKTLVNTQERRLLARAAELEVRARA